MVKSEWEKVAESSSLSSNDLFQVLTDWNDQIRRAGIDFDRLGEAPPASPAPIQSRPPKTLAPKRRRRGAALQPRL